MSVVKTIDITPEELAKSMKECLKTLPYSFSSNPSWLRFKGMLWAVKNRIAPGGTPMGYSCDFKDCALMNNHFPVEGGEREYTEADIDAWAKKWGHDPVTAVYRVLDKRSFWLATIIPAY